MINIFRVVALLAHALCAVRCVFSEWDGSLWRWWGVHSCNFGRLSLGGRPRRISCWSWKETARGRSGRRLFGGRDDCIRRDKSRLGISVEVVVSIVIIRGRMIVIIVVIRVRHILRGKLIEGFLYGPTMTIGECKSERHALSCTHGGHEINNRLGHW